MDAVKGSENRRLGDIEDVGKEFFGEVMPQVEKGNFQGLVQVEGSWSDRWFVSGEVLVQGCGEYGELLGGEPGCTIVSQRSFRWC